PVALLHVRLKLNRESRAMPAVLERSAAERLEDRAAGVRAELEAALDIELVDGADQRHIAFRNDLGKVDVAQSCALGHRQPQRQVGANQVFAEVLKTAMPLQEF